MNACIFCKIIAGDIPARRVYEDADVCAFLDIQPVSPGHTLVVPKVHAPTLLEVQEEVLLKTVRVLPLLGQAVVEATKAEGFTVSQNNGEAAGQTVHHLHFHLIPRRLGDGLKPWPQRASVSEEEADALAEKIKQGARRSEQA